MDVDSGFGFCGNTPPPFQGSNYGYSSGGKNPTVTTNIIDKFPFSADANATDVGDLTVGRYAGAGQSSQTHGYTSGGKKRAHSK